jgi:hypothetical protein
MSNLLDKYRRGVQEDRESQRPTIETVEGKPYKAFESAPIPQRRLDLRPGYDAQRIISYGYLTDIMYAGDFMLTLRCGPGFVANINGRNLTEMISLLREERLTAIQEHIPEWHVQPGENDPYIEKLEITDASLPGSKSKKPGKH